jgi:hypothetical protein
MNSAVSAAHIVFLCQAVGYCGIGYLTIGIPANDHRLEADTLSLAKSLPPARVSLHRIRFGWLALADFRFGVLDLLCNLLVTGIETGGLLPCFQRLRYAVQF